MASLGELKIQVDLFNGLIIDNYSALNGLLATLKEDVSSSVEATVASMNPAPTVMDTVELDENWWSEHGEEMGWIPDGKGSYVYTDPDTGETFSYNPKTQKLKQDGVGSVTCALYLNGDPADVTETVTLLKSYVGDDPVIYDNSTRPQLIIAPRLTGDEDNPGQTAKLALMSTKFGDAFLKSGGNDKDVTKNLCGFSMGGIQAVKMVSGRFGDEYVGYYDKVTLVNISPSILRYNDKEVQNLSGLTFDIVENYNNANKTADFMADFYTNQRGGPHLDKLASIPGATVNLYVPDLTYDTHGELTKMVARAEGLDTGNVNVIQFSVPTDDLEAYGSGTKSSSHENGRRILMPRYLAGDLTPIE